MNIHWKQLLFWTLLAVVIFYYLLLFGVFVFVNQEEMQLFIRKHSANPVLKITKYLCESSEILQGYS